MKKTELIEAAKRLKLCEDVTYWSVEKLYKLQDSHKPSVIARSFGSNGCNALVLQSQAEPARFFLITSRTSAYWILNN